MIEPVSLDEIKADLRLELDECSHDASLARLIVAARRMVELRTGRSFGGEAPTLTGDDGVAGAQAISAIVAHWFANPEAATTDGRNSPIEVPMSAGWIIESLKKWDDGK